MTNLALVEERKTKVLADLILREFRRPDQVLVVGCGTGAEAGALARYFSADTIGIDIDDAEFNVDRASPARLMEMDAEALEFPDMAFDLVFSFHSLEHMGDPARALDEMSRVLKPGGMYVVGTPNGQRFLGYVGSPVPLRTKIAWNVHDLRARARGDWSNQQGEHVGFSRAELSELCGEAFGSVHDISNAYYSALYPRFGRMMGLLGSPRRLTDHIYPSVYVAGTPSGNA